MNELKHKKALMDFVTENAPDIDQELLKQLVSKVRIEMRDIVCDHIVSLGNDWQNKTSKDIKGMPSEDYTEGFTFGTRSCGNGLHVLAHAISDGTKGDVKNLVD